MGKTLAALWALCLLAIGALAVTPRPAAAAATIKTQAPCTNGGDNCFNFGVGILGLVEFDLRSFTFKAPSKGNAAVSFNGSLVCGADLSGNNRVVDLVMQITNSTSGAASANLPGGLRQAMVLATNTSNTFNLAATRVFTFNGASTQTFHYRVRPRRIDPGTNCFIYNAAFTVVFIP